MTSVYVILTILANAFANIFLKIGADKSPAVSLSTPSSFYALLTNFWVILGALLFVTNFPLYNLVLQKMKLSIAFPLVTSSAFALSALIAFYFLDEKLSLTQYFGVLLLIAAIWLIAGSK